jgi:hypothetical protein
MNKFESMSDQDFINLLESKLHHASWNVGEIVELERRGVEIINSRDELSREILKKRADFTATVNRALEPYSRQFEKLSESINSFKSIKVGNALSLNPALQSELISSPKVAEELVLTEVTKLLDLSLGELRGIRTQSARDWFHWSGWVFSLIAALTSIVAVTSLFFN